MSRHNSSTSNFKDSVLFVIIKVAAYFAILFAIFFNVITPQYIHNYCASLLDKMERLESIDEPKIALLGHSGLSFGIRSKVIEDELNMPVVNMGLHGGLGNAFYENMAKINVTPGDIYVICHSDFTGDGGILNPAIAWITIENHWNLYRLIPTDQWYEMGLAFPTYVKKSLNLYLTDTGNGIEDSSYCRYSFNEYGDDIYSATHEEHYEFPEDFVLSAPKIDEQTVRRLNELNRYVTSRGASLVICAYPIPYNEKTDAQAFSAFGEELQERLDCTVISDYTDYFFPFEDFYNTEMHLTDEAAYRMSAQLAEDLKEYVEGREENG